MGKTAWAADDPDYECSWLLEYFFFQMNGWHATLWITLIFVTLQKPKKEQLAYVWSPYVLMLVGVQVNGVLHPSDESVPGNAMTSSAVNLVCNLAWVALFGLLYRLHLEPLPQEQSAVQSKSMM